VSDVLTHKLWVYKSDVADAVELYVDRVIPQKLSRAERVALYEEQADRILIALRSLPVGTYDALQRKLRTSKR